MDLVGHFSCPPRIFTIFFLSHSILVCCSPWGHKELDTTERLNWTYPKVEFNLLIISLKFIGWKFTYGENLCNSKKASDVRMVLWFRLRKGQWWLRLNPSLATLGCFYDDYNNFKKKHKSSKKESLSSNPMWIQSLLSPSSINRMFCLWEEQIIKFSQK